MTWTDDVRAFVETLPVEFRLRDLYRFIPRLHRLHPQNEHIEEKIRQQLQVLRDEGAIEFVAPGEYRRLGVAAAGFPLKPGDTTTRAELADILGIGGPVALHRGMFKRARGEYANDLMLFHHAEGNPYGDAIDEDQRIIYVGQGQEGNQSLDGFNRDLARHLEDGVRVHFFVKETAAGSELSYQGQVVLEQVERVFRDDEGRSVLEFTLIPALAEIDADVFGEAYQEMLDESLEPHLVERVATFSRTRRTLRDRAFAALVRDLYRNECAICGPPLTNLEEEALDVQGAHVRPVSAQGPDARNNGICLCARHHWAFDHGVFSISDSYQILMPEEFTDPHDELRRGLEMALPKERQVAPHPEYLSWHRANWRFT